MAAMTTVTGRSDEEITPEKARPYKLMARVTPTPNRAIANTLTVMLSPQGQRQYHQVAPDPTESENRARKREPVSSGAGLVAVVVAVTVQGQAQEHACTDKDHQRPPARLATY